MLARITRLLRAQNPAFFNINWLLAEKVVGSGFLILTSIVVARTLGPENFGVLSSAMALVALFAVAGNFGLSGLVVRELVRAPDAYPKVLGSTLLLKGAGYLIAAALVVGYGLIFLPSPWVAIILACSLLFRPTEIIDYLFQANRNFRDLAIVRTGAQIVSGVARILAAWYLRDPVAVAVAIVVQDVIIAALYLVLLRTRFSLTLPDLSVSRPYVMSLVRQGMLLFAGAILATIYLRIDQVMIASMLGVREAGIFAVAATLSESWYFLPVAAVSALFPGMIALHLKDKAVFYQRFQRLLDVLFLMALAIAIFVSLTAPWLIRLLYGADYVLAAPVLVIHVWSGLFIFMRTAFSRWILIEGELLFSLLTHGAGAVVNVVLNLIMIPHFGIVGAAISTLLSYAMASYVALAFNGKTRPVFILMTRSIVSPFRFILFLLRRLRSLPRL